MQIFVRAGPRLWQARAAGDMYHLPDARGGSPVVRRLRRRTEYPTMPSLKMRWRDTMAVASTTGPSKYVETIKFSPLKKVPGKQAWLAAATMRLVAPATSA